MPSAHRVLLIFVALVAASCGAPALQSGKDKNEAVTSKAVQVGTESGTPNTDQRKALEIAKSFLAEQTWAGEYLPETARVVDGETEWLVWIKKMDWENVIPRNGLITVDKVTGAVEWKSLK